MSEKVKCEIYLAMNEDGDYEVATADADDARNSLSENCGGSQSRVVKITVWMTPPADVENGPTIDIPDTAGTTETIEVAAE